MNWNLILVFVGFNILNVIIQTIKSIATVKGGKAIAAVVNAVAYGLYTYIVILTMADLPLLMKCLIVAACNFVGVFVVKLCEERARKAKLWKIEATVHEPYTESLRDALNKAEIPNNYIPNIGKYTVFNVFCETQAESKTAKEILDYHKAKYFVSESKVL